MSRRVAQADDAVDDRTYITHLKSDILDLLQRCGQLYTNFDPEKEIVPVNASQASKQLDFGTTMPADVEAVFKKCNFSEDPAVLSRSKLGLIELLCSKISDIEKSVLLMTEKYATSRKTPREMSRRSISRLSTFLALLDRMSEICRQLEEPSERVEGGLATAPDTSSRGPSPDEQIRALRETVDRLEDELRAAREKRSDGKKDAAGAVRGAKEPIKLDRTKQAVGVLDACVSFEKKRKQEVLSVFEPLDRAMLKWEQQRPHLLRDVQGAMDRDFTFPDISMHDPQDVSSLKAKFCSSLELLICDDALVSGESRSSSASKIKSLSQECSESFSKLAAVGGAAHQLSAAVAWLMEVVSAMILELKRTKNDSRHALQSVRAELMRDNDQLSTTVATLRAELTALKTIVTEPQKALTPTPPKGDTPTRRARPSATADPCTAVTCPHSQQAIQLRDELAQLREELTRAEQATTSEPTVAAAAAACTDRLADAPCAAMTIVPSIEVDSKFFEERITDMEQRHRYEHVQRDEQYSELEAKLVAADETVDELKQELKWKAADLEIQAQRVAQLTLEVEGKRDANADGDSYEAVLAGELVAMREGFELQARELRERMEHEAKRHRALLRQAKDRHEQELKKAKKLKDMADIRVRQLEERLKQMVELRSSASTTPTLTP